MFFHCCNPQDCKRIMTLVWQDSLEILCSIILCQSLLNEFPEYLNKKFLRNFLDYNSCFFVKNNQGSGVYNHTKVIVLDIVSFYLNANEYG